MKSFGRPALTQPSPRGRGLFQASVAAHTQPALLAKRGLGLDVATLAAAFAFYLAALAPDVLGHDSGEFQFVPPLLGIAHPTGYPLYTLLGWSWSHLLPLGSVAWRMNLLSAVFGAAAVALVGHVARRLSRQWPAGLLAAALFAVAPAVWEWSVVAGVRSMDLMLQAAVLLLALGWREASSRPRADPKAAARRSGLWLAGLSFGVGLALAHHRNAAFLLPGVALFLVLSRPRPRVGRRALVGLVALLALPLLTYLYLPLRSAAGAPFDQLQATGLRDLWAHVLGLSEASDFLDLGAAAALSRLGLVGGEVSRQLMPFGVVLAMAGVGWLARRDARSLALLALPALGLLAAEVIWREEGWALEMKFLRAALVPLAVLAGVGAGGLVGLLARSAGRAAPATATGLMLMALLPFACRGTALWQEHEERAARPLDVFRQELRDGWRPRRLALTSLPLLEPNAILLADWEQATVYWYLQLVEGVNRHVEVRYPLAALDDVLREAGSRPLYLAAVRPGMKDALASHPVGGVGSVVRVGPGAVSGTTPALSLSRTSVFGDQISLLGADFWDEGGQRRAEPRARNGVISLSLYWRALRTPDADYAVSVRLVDETGRVAAQSDLTHPVLRLSPTSGWRAGEVRGDYHEVPVRGLPAGPYRLAVTLYVRDAGGFQNLTVQDAGGNPAGEAAVLAVVERGKGEGG